MAGFVVDCLLQILRRHSVMVGDHVAISMDGLCRSGLLSLYAAVTTPATKVDDSDDDAGNAVGGAKRAASAAASAKRKLPSSCKHERGDDEQALVPHVPFGELCSANDAVDLAESKPAYVDHLFQVSFKGKQTAGKRRNHLTPRGQLVTAIRRIISQSAANSFGAAILTDMDGKSVNNCERVLGACSIASFMAFHQRMESELVDAKHRALERGIVTHAYSAGLSA
ncbi:hypothetical protein AK812_SmicGene16515 [Symbiodinium microadriaticum]|uniref:Uncharacterized protein n=1 Tax=Symbiodinium microadriaticum TaxID=2951 RepID=A0A1Q9E041_SYMMI|nr:hypothetical protein AK812_SmicGene16515 [Symbiodinium microadriaticum]CAE7781807.1 unnamed protein product [Symbiodinium microadriaticum]